jgi:hypothetical protein
MPPTSEVIVRDSLLSGTLASYGASAVARTSDRGRVSEVYHFQSVWGSQSGFPLLTPIMETYDGPAWRLMATLLSAPFQGFARQCGIQVFRFYSTLSPVARSQCRSVMARVSPSHPYNADRAQNSDGGGGGGSEAMCTLHAVIVLWFWS